MINITREEVEELGRDILSIINVQSVEINIHFKDGTDISCNKYDKGEYE